MPERAAEELNPEMGRMGAEDPSTAFSAAPLDAGQPHSRGSNGYGEFPVRQGLSKGWVGCVGFQIDGPDFTETITAFAAP